jgi:ferredoxin
VKIILDQEACMGYANCVIEAPELFDIDEETDKALVLVETPEGELQEAAREAVRVCPAVALRLEE